MKKDFLSSGSAGVIGGGPNRFGFEGGDTARSFLLKRSVQN